MSVPPVLDIVRYCEETAVRRHPRLDAGSHGAGRFPGVAHPAGAVRHQLSYRHTRCVGRLTDDKLNEEAAWTYTRWFYQRCDLTFVPSAWSSRDLASHGLDQRKMAVLHQGIDADRFSPEFRSEEWRRRPGWRRDSSLPASAGGSRQRRAIKRSCCSSAACRRRRTCVSSRNATSNWRLEAPDVQSGHGRRRTHARRARGAAG